MYPIKIGIIQMLKVLLLIIIRILQYQINMINQVILNGG